MLQEEKMTLFCLLIKPDAAILENIFHHKVLDFGAYLFLN